MIVGLALLPVHQPSATGTFTATRRAVTVDSIEFGATALLLATPCIGRRKDMSDTAADRYSILTTVAGVSYRQDAVSGCREGQTVQLMRDSTNMHDQNAIQVHSGELIGFIPKAEAEILALYLDYFGSDDVEATINQLTGGTKHKQTIGVILDIQVSEEFYNLIVQDPDFVRESIVREKRIEEINASLSDEDVKEYIRGVDDLTLDSRYWLEQQNKWETEQKEKAEKRLGRELESYEEQEIDERAETRFLKFHERYEVTSREREK